jgi:hypothetical protein
MVRLLEGPILSRSSTGRRSLLARSWNTNSNVLLGKVGQKQFPCRLKGEIRGRPQGECTSDLPPRETTKTFQDQDGEGTDAAAMEMSVASARILRSEEPADVQLSGPPDVG